MATNAVYGTMKKIVDALINKSNKGHAHSQYIIADNVGDPIDFSSIVGMSIQYGTADPSTGFSGTPQNGDIYFKIQS